MQFIDGLRVLAFVEATGAALDINSSGHVLCLPDAEPLIFDDEDALLDFVKTHDANTYS